MPVAVIVLLLLVFMSHIYAAQMAMFALVDAASLFSLSYLRSHQANGNSSSCIWPFSGPTSRAAGAIS